MNPSGCMKKDKLQNTNIFKNTTPVLLTLDSYGCVHILYDTYM